MNILAELRARFQTALTGLAADPAAAAELVRPNQDPKHGDYQANCAMPLAKQLGEKDARAVAAKIIERLKIDDLCDPPEVAGPGFINLRLKESWLIGRLTASVQDERLTIEPAAKPRKVVVDFSGPNVAKPMHVGHIRSTVIGDALVRTLRFLGHDVVGDNHLGDWGTQFGMMFYGYRHFLDAEAYRAKPVEELARLYRLVRKLLDYYAALTGQPALEAEIAKREAAIEKALAEKPADPKKAKEHAKDVAKLQAALKAKEEDLEALCGKIAAVSADTNLSALAAEHKNIAADVQTETAKLHAGDADNLKLWHEFMPYCLADIDHIYQRLGVTFDVTLGESFYQPRLAGVVADLQAKGIARESQGAICVFTEGFATPFIVQRSNGGFLYATTDLATIQYRMETWHPQAMLYVVDHRQGDHFKQLFATAAQWGYANVEFQHVSFGTVMGPDGKPYRTRGGDTVGLEGLLNEAVERAHAIVCENDDRKPNGAELDESTRRQVATVVGMAAIKYADLSQNRTSDYEFSYDKMLAMTGNTATYMQYAYARNRSIFAKGEVNPAQLRQAWPAITLAHPNERKLAIALIGFHEALEEVLREYRPNQLTAYLWTLANAYSGFFENCPVLKAETPELKNSRFLLCDLTARTIQKGLELLGIGVCEKM